MGMHQLDEQQVSLVRSLGIRLVRYTMYWAKIENTTTPGQYDPEQLRVWDELVRFGQQQGIVFEIVVHQNAPGVGWANREEGSRRFAQFMFDMAKRYPQIRYWELWNEMDSGFTDLFGANRDDVSLRERGKLYAQMLKIVYPRIREANPDAFVLTGGMTDWNEFPRGIYEGGGRDFFDIMALHTYGVPLKDAFVSRGRQVRAIMREFGDADKPLWNNEFGIDAGNFVAAWGYPHTYQPPVDDATFFDQEQLRSWRDCLDWNRESGVYTKVLPYQFAAGNERDDGGDIKQKSQLPEGRTIDDFGFGIVRRDGRTPRPTYDWLLTEQFNRAIRNEPKFQVDIRCRLPEGRIPVGYDCEREGDELVIRHVTVDSDYPTRIFLTELKP